jgi:hypothetical protein
VENLKKEMKTAAVSTKEGEAEKDFEEVTEVSPSSSSHSHSRAGYQLASSEEIQALLSPLKTEIQRIQLYRNKSESLLEKEKEDKENRENQLGDEEGTYLHPHRPSSEKNSNKKNKKQQPGNENKNRKASQRQQQRKEKAEKDQMDFQDLFFKEAQTNPTKGNDQQEIQRPFSPSDLAMMTSSLALDSGKNKTNVSKPVIQFDPNKWNINNRNDNNHNNNNNEDDEFFLPPISGRQPSQPQSQPRTSRSAEFDSRRTFSAGSNVGEGPPSVSSSNPYSQSRRVKPPKQQTNNGAEHTNDSSKINRSPRTNRFHYSQQQQQNGEDEQDEESEGNRMDFSPRDEQPDYEIEADEDKDEDQEEEEEEESNEIETNWLRHKKLLVDKVREFVEC